MKRYFLTSGFIFLLFVNVPGLQAQKQQASFKDHSPGYEIAAFYFPDYHNNDPGNL